MAAKPPAITKRSIIRFAVFVAFGIGALVVLHWARGNGWLDLEFVRARLEALRETWWSPLALIGLYLLLAPLGFPVTPLIFSGGVIFGPWLGSLYNVVGTFLAALVSFGVAQFLGRDFVAELIGERRVARLDGLLEEHSFWPLVSVRYLPVPFPLINYGAALAGVSFRTFALTSFLGLLPGISIYTYVWSTLVSVAGEGRADVLRNLFVVVALLAAINLLPILLRRKSSGAKPKP